MGDGGYEYLHSCTAAPLLFESAYAFNQGFIDSIASGTAPDGGAPAPAILGTVFDSNAASYYDSGAPFSVDLQFLATGIANPATTVDDFAYWTYGDPQPMIWNPLGSDSVNSVCGAISIGSVISVKVPAAEQTADMPVSEQCTLY